MDPLHLPKGIGGEDLAAPRGQEAELPRGKAGQIERRGGVPRGGSNALGLIEGERLAVAVAEADLLIYDATFTDAEWPGRRGWGHSTWEEGLRLKRRAGVKLLALAHHEPSRTDDALDALAQTAAAACGNAFFARQGLRLEV